LLSGSLSLYVFLFISRLVCSLLIQRILFVVLCFVPPDFWLLSFSFAGFEPSGSLLLPSLLFNEAYVFFSGKKSNQLLQIFKTISWYLKLISKRKTFLKMLLGT